MQPLERYNNDLQAGLISQDSEQQRVVGLLHTLHGELVQASSQKGNLLQRAFASLSATNISSRPRGMYLWGGVGRGKTYLMDMFYDCLPGERKKRTHFYRFMQQAHKALAKEQGRSDPLRHVATSLAAEIDVLCFDEFFVSDIGDAMILAGLLEALFDAGVVLIATSNVPPQGLYENGLQRERFLPAIALLEQHTAVVEIKAGVDYRLRSLSQSELFHVSEAGAVDAQLLASFNELAPDHLKVLQNHSLTILDREIPTRVCADDVAWFEFAALCDGPRSAFDYVEIAKLFHAIIISNVPQLDDEKQDQTRRFISLIDELYDRRVKLIIAAEVALDDLYSGKHLAFEMQRTHSRLVEMQSQEYLGVGHRA